MISQTEIETLLKSLCRDQLVNLGVGDGVTRGWFRARDGRRTRPREYFRRCVWR